MSDRKGRYAHVRATLLAVALAVVSWAVPAPAAAAPPTPQSATTCGGFVSKDPSPTVDDPILIDYTFHCDGDISAYTLIVNRRPTDTETIDDFSTTADVLDPTTGAAVSTESLACDGTIPGDGINCNAGAGGVVSAWDHGSGTFDLTAPYCKNIPAGSKPGTIATPTAFVQLVVTDTTGAEDGPFGLGLNSACPAVPDRVPFPKPKPKPKAKKHKRITTNKGGHK